MTMSVNLHSAAYNSGHDPSHSDCTIRPIEAAYGERKSIPEPEVRLQVSEHKVCMYLEAVVEDISSSCHCKDEQE